MMLWRGATEWPEFGTGRTMVIAGGNTAKLVVYPIAPGTGTKLTNWAIGVVTGRPGDPPPSEQDWARPADPADLAEHIKLFTHDHFDHAAMIEATRDRFEFPMCDRDPLPTGRGAASPSWATPPTPCTRWARTAQARPSWTR